MSAAPKHSVVQAQLLATYTVDLESGEVLDVDFEAPRTDALAVVEGPQLAREQLLACFHFTNKIACRYTVCFQDPDGRYFMRRIRARSAAEILTQFERELGRIIPAGTTIAQIFDGAELVYDSAAPLT